MSDDGFSVRLKEVIASHTEPRDRRFELAQRENAAELTYDAVFAGDTLPLVDMKRLGVVPSAQPEGQQQRITFPTGEAVYPIAGMFDGYFEGKKLVVFLRCDNSPA